jgi:hypothetical protein
MIKNFISKNLIIITFINAFLFVTNIVRSQDTLSKGVKDGWAIHIGAGVMYGGNIGFLTERQILLKENLRISPFGSFGFAIGGTDSIGGKYNSFEYAAGANLEYGKKHRIILGPHFVGQNIIGNSVDIKKKSLMGASFIIGYKGTANFGLIWQVYIGDIYLQDQFSSSKKYSHSSHMGLGIGYKF